MVRIGGTVRTRHGEFSGYCLAHYHGAGKPEQRYCGRVLGRSTAGEQRGAVFGRQVGCIDDVLDADGNTLQGPRFCATSKRLVRGASAREKGQPSLLWPTSLRSLSARRF